MRDSSVVRKGDPRAWRAEHRVISQQARCRARFCDAVWDSGGCEPAAHTGLIYSYSPLFEPQG